jgi:hypothetical protein
MTQSGRIDVSLNALLAGCQKVAACAEPDIITAPEEKNMFPLTSLLL